MWTGLAWGGEFPLPGHCQTEWGKNDSGCKLGKKKRESQNQTERKKKVKRAMGKVSLTAV